MPVDPLLPRRRAAARDEAIRRVSRITAASVLAGTAASIGFAGLAAATYTGTSTIGTTPTTDATLGRSRVYDGQPRVYQSQSQPVTAPNPIQVAQPPVRSSGRARVTVGGS
jgi:hypothetical protein